MDAADVVRRMWERIEARDWPGLGELLEPEVRVQWPATGELFVGRADFLAVQSEYPEGWSIRPLRIVSQGDTVVSEVEVPHAPSGQIFRVAGFYLVREGRVAAATEYWVTVGGDDPPEWRRRFAVPA